MTSVTVEYIGGPWDGRIEVRPDLSVVPVYGNARHEIYLLGRYRYDPDHQRRKGSPGLPMTFAPHHTRTEEREE